MVFGQTENFEFVKKRIPSERASQEEQNGANFSSIAPSSEELRVPKPQIYAYGNGRHKYKYVYCCVCKHFVSISP